MEISAFYDAVEAHPELEGLGVDPTGDRAFIIRHRPTHITTRVPVAAVADADWDTLEAVLTTRREPVALSHMTRVIGYFSRIENWNKSKQGELRDRRKGNYAIGDVQ